jgi:hypothetical protein
MQTITFNDTTISAYLFSDEDDLTATTTNTISPHFAIGDMNSTNSTIHKNVTSPNLWQGGNYLFDGATWTLNPNWTDPKLAEIAELEARIAELKGAS